MNRTASISMIVLAGVLGLNGQGTRKATPMAFPAEIPPATITITGIDGKKIDITAADLFKLPQHTIKTTGYGAPATFEGVLLTDVLAKVDLPLGEKFHNTAAAYYLVVEAKDGYRAVFAWAELDLTFMDKPVYVAMKRDGKPLSVKEGPFELVAPGEKRGARWVRQVTAMTLRQAN